jgi:hypothetical protein
VASKPAAVYKKSLDGLVVSQTPAGGAYATANSTVTIYIDEKKVKPPSPTATTTVGPVESTEPSVTITPTP